MSDYKSAPAVTFATNILSTTGARDLGTLLLQNLTRPPFPHINLNVYVHVEQFHKGYHVERVRERCHIKTTKKFISGWFNIPKSTRNVSILPFGPRPNCMHGTAYLQFDIQPLAPKTIHTCTCTYTCTYMSICMYIHMYMYFIKKHHLSWLSLSKLHVAWSWQPYLLSSLQYHWASVSNISSSLLPSSLSATTEVFGEATAATDDTWKGEGPFTPTPAVLEAACFRFWAKSKKKDHY